MALASCRVACTYNYEAVPIFFSRKSVHPVSKSSTNFAIVDRLSVSSYFPQSLRPNVEYSRPYLDNRLRTIPSTNFPTLTHNHSPPSHYTLHYILNHTLHYTIQPTQCRQCRSIN